MAQNIAGRLATIQQQHGEQLLSVITALLVLLLFVLVPLHAAGLWIAEVLSGLVLLAIAGLALLASGSVPAFAVLTLGFVINLVAVILRVTAPSRLDAMLLSLAWMLLAITMIALVARMVFRHGHVTKHRVIGAVLLYLLVATVFVAAFAMIGILIPAAFTGLKIEDGPVLASNLIYFSFVTLTSTGFGDVVPVHPIARSLCNLETIIGQLYPATLLARLVTLELEHRR